MAALRANLRKALRGAPVAHIVAQCPPSARVAMDVLSQLGLRDDVGVTMVCHFNGSEADEYRDQGALRGEAHVRVKAQEERVLREVDRVVYVSSWARQLVEQQRGIRTRASSVVWNGISELSARHASISRADLGLSESDLVLINVGTLEPRKNQLGLLQVFARIVAEHPHAKLLLAGEGPHRPLIEAAAVELNIASNVKLLGHRRNVAELLTVADLYVHFASAENCPISLIEAARAGLPWAAKPVGGVCELLNALGGGVALDLDSIDRSMQALRPLLASKDHRRALGEQARAQFATGFTQSAMVRAYVRALGLGQVGSGQ
jgi:glycosyltransferase involved in cell wall biosynthesis